MKISTKLALFVFAASLAYATLNYSVPYIDFSVPLSAFSLDTGNDFAVTPPPDLIEPDSIAPDNENPDYENIVKYTFPEDPLVPDAKPRMAWLELFHQR